VAVAAAAAAAAAATQRIEGCNNERVITGMQHSWLQQLQQHLSLVVTHGIHVQLEWQQQQQQ
jgi:hypothetical protein